MGQPDTKNLPNVTLTHEQMKKFEEFRQVASLLAFDINIQWDVAKDSEGFEELMESLKLEEDDNHEAPEEPIDEPNAGKYWFEIAKSLLWQLRTLKENRDKYTNDPKARAQQFGLGQVLFGAVASGQVRVEKIG